MSGGHITPDDFMTATTVVDKPAIKCEPCPKCEDGVLAMACPHCDGKGERPVGARAVNIRDPIATQLEVQRDGWREIANALMACAFGHEVGAPRDVNNNIGPWTAVPPVELLEGVRSADAIEGIRAAILGRAWRVGGRVGAGTCDYPLCQHRPKSVEDRREASTHRMNRVHLRDVDGVEVAHLTVCSARNGKSMHPANVDDECERWATWVSARVRTGRIAVQR